MPGLFSRATETMPSPMGPMPAITTTSPSWMFPRSTAWMAHASGSIRAA